MIIWSYIAIAKERENERATVSERLYALLSHSPLGYILGNSLKCWSGPRGDLVCELGGYTSKQQQQQQQIERTTIKRRQSLHVWDMRYVICSRNSFLCFFLIVAWKPRHRLSWWFQHWLPVSQPTNQPTNSANISLFAASRRRRCGNLMMMTQPQSSTPATTTTTTTTTCRLNLLVCVCVCVCAGDTKPQDAANTHTHNCGLTR